MPKINPPAIRRLLRSMTNVVAWAYLTFGLRSANRSDASYDKRSVQMAIEDWRRHSLICGSILKCSDARCVRHCCRTRRSATSAVPAACTRAGSAVSTMGNAGSYCEKGDSPRSTCRCRLRSRPPPFLEHTLPENASARAVGYRAEAASPPSPAAGGGF